MDSSHRRFEIPWKKIMNSPCPNHPTVCVLDYVYRKIYTHYYDSNFTWYGESNWRFFSKNLKLFRKESVFICSICWHVTPFTNCPILIERTSHDLMNLLACFRAEDLHLFHSTDQIPRKNLFWTPLHSSPPPCALLFILPPTLPLPRLFVSSSSFHLPSPPPASSWPSLIMNH